MFYNYDSSFYPNYYQNCQQPMYTNTDLSCIERSTSDPSNVYSSCSYYDSSPSECVSFQPTYTPSYMPYMMQQIQAPMATPQMQQPKQQDIYNALGYYYCENTGVNKKKRTQQSDKRVPSESQYIYDFYNRDQQTAINDAARYAYEKKLIELMNKNKSKMYNQNLNCMMANQSQLNTNNSSATNNAKPPRAKSAPQTLQDDKLAHQFSNLFLNSVEPPFKNKIGGATKVPSEPNTRRIQMPPFVPPDQEKLLNPKFKGVPLYFNTLELNKKKTKLADKKKPQYNDAAVIPVQYSNGNETIENQKKNENCNPNIYQLVNGYYVPVWAQVQQNMALPNFANYYAYNPNSQISNGVPKSSSNVTTANNNVEKQRARSNVNPRTRPSNNLNGNNNNNNLNDRKRFSSLNRPTNNYSNGNYYNNSSQLYPNDYDAKVSVVHSYNDLPKRKQELEQMREAERSRLLSPIDSFKHTMRASFVSDATTSRLFKSDMSMADSILDVPLPNDNASEYSEFVNNVFRKALKS